MRFARNVKLIYQNFNNARDGGLIGMECHVYGLTSRLKSKQIKRGMLPRNWSTVFMGLQFEERQSDFISAQAEWLFIVPKLCFLLAVLLERKQRAGYVSVFRELAKICGCACNRPENAFSSAKARWDKRIARSFYLPPARLCWPRRNHLKWPPRVNESSKECCIKMLF